MSTYMMMSVAGVLFVGCLIFTTVLVPIVVRFARRIEAVDRGGYRKFFQGAMPLLGGLGIAVPVVIVGVVATTAGHIIVANWKWFYINYSDSFSLLFSFADSRNDNMTIAIGGVAIVALGLIDDIRGMRARWKILGQIAIALFVCVSGYTLTTVSLPFVGEWHLGLPAGGLLTMLWVVGLINAFNLIDGVDGLATGSALIGTIALVILSVVQDNMYVLFVGVAFAGSLFAFLRVNFPPAKIFLGDTGSMFIGYVLAVLTLVGAQKSEAATIVIAPMLALSLPVFETFVSIARRYLRGVPIFSGDADHTHHRLLDKGYSQPEVVLTLYGIAILLAAAAILSAVIPENSMWIWCSYTLYVGSLFYIAWLAGYLKPTTFRKTYKRRQRNKVFQALRRYITLRLNAEERPANMNFLLDLCRNELGLRHIEIQTEDGVQLMVSSDGAKGDKTEPLQEKLLVKSTTEQNILVLYTFEHEILEDWRHDVSFCLAGIFDKLVIEQAVKSDENTL